MRNKIHSFTTERLLIRPLLEQDKNLYLSLYCDTKIMRNIGEPLSTKDAEKAFARTLNAMTKPLPKVLTWAIVDKETNKAIGIQGLTLISPTENKPFITDSKTAEIGIMLSRQSHGKQIPEEAIGALVEYGLEIIQFTNIIACFSEKNFATQRVAKKVGFKPCSYAQLELSGAKVESISIKTLKSRYLAHYLNT